MSDETPADPWADLTAALDAANRQAARRELAMPIGGMYYNDRISVSDGVFQAGEPPIPYWGRSTFAIDAPSLTIQQERTDDDE